jgi:hypothetical protein
MNWVPGYSRKKVSAAAGGENEISHQRDRPVPAMMAVIMQVASARIEDRASDDGGPSRLSTRCQVAAAWAQSGSSPDPEVQANSVLPDSTRRSRAAPE